MRIGRMAAHRRRPFERATIGIGGYLPPAPRTNPCPKPLNGERR
jgi:hypothetical protein